MIICSFDHCQNNILRSQSLNWDDIFIDEFHHIMWELQANLIPKFGYCSFKFDDVAQGKSLVQGQLAINFVSPGYLIGALLGATAVTTGSASGSSASSDTEIQMQQLLIEAATLSETNTPATVARMARSSSRPISWLPRWGPVVYRTSLPPCAAVTTVTVSYCREAPGVSLHGKPTPASRVCRRLLRS